MPDEHVITQDEDAVYRAGIRRSDSNYQAARAAARQYFAQGASFDTVVSNLQAQFSTQSTTSAPTKAPSSFPPNLSINELGAIANKTPASDTSSLLNLIMQRTGMDEGEAASLLAAANSGDPDSIALLGFLGIEPFASAIASKNKSGGGSSGGGGGSGGGGYATISPLEEVRTRQALALFDPNYPDGALIPLPDGTSRINGTEIIIDARAKGDFKPVTGAPGYLVDPVTGTIIDTNGNQIARDQLQEVIRSNQAREGLTRYGTDVEAELGRGKLALDTTLGVGGLNLQAATSENEQKLKNILETEGLNLESFLGTGKLNIGATEAETGRLNALTGRSAAAGGLASDLQKLQDARTLAVIDLMANPQDFVEREYATRALISPPGYTGPAFKDDPRLSQIIDTLMTTPDVSGLLPTYTAPQFQPVDLPNPTLPRVTAPAPQPQAVAPPPIASNTRIATPAESGAYFREKGVPEWALQPLGFAHGTGATREREFVVGDPQLDGGANPELVKINNPGPKTSTSVTPLRDLMNEGSSMPPDQITMGREMGNMNNSSSGGLSKLIAEVLVEISNVWGEQGGGGNSVAKYAYGTNPTQGGWPIDTNAVSERFANAGNNNDMNQIPTNAPSTIPNYMTPTTSNKPPTFTPNYMTPIPTNTPMGNPLMPTSNMIQSPILASRPENVVETILSHYKPYGVERRLQGREPLTNWQNSDYYPVNNRNIDSSSVDSGNTNSFNRLRDYLMQYFGDRGLNTNLINWNSFPTNLMQRWGNSNSAPTSPPNNQLGINPRWDEGGLSYFAYGTDYGSDYKGPVSSTGQPLGQLTSYDNKAIRNMPNIQFAKDAGNRTAYNTLNTGNISGPFGTTLPDVGGLNYTQLWELAQDPDSWGVLSSIYRAANRNLEGILNRVRNRAPIGQITPQSMIRTVSG